MRKLLPDGIGFSFFYGLEQPGKKQSRQSNGHKTKEKIWRTYRIRLLRIWQQ
ncbi:Uncharacterized protein dnm_012850 [Desulfonema magnum]|uniref:Uncharacterized protein n=1 Tax=Desulfonema magnum TaxID=45655 RepID=A0A975BHB6_9BACT|nr:Uncharacterized protein dnm_012850 [Desulfonema magnum]